MDHGAIWVRQYVVLTLCLWLYLEFTGLYTSLGLKWFFLLHVWQNSKNNVESNKKLNPGLPPPKTQNKITILQNKQTNKQTNQTTKNNDKQI